jgi:site-specific DNA-methyltransferase (adenine-specific)
MTWDIQQGDCRELMNDMADNSVALICVDPPYHRVKALDWDRQWSTDGEYLDWIGTLCQQWQRILKPNGSLYVFASPKMAARVECKIGERFNVLNRIVWAKPPYSTKAEMRRKEGQRTYSPVTEYVFFAEHYGADNIAKGESGYGAKCDELRGFVFEPLRAYLDGERQRAGVSFEQVRLMVGCASGSGLPSHWFTRSQWMLPTAANYTKLQAGFNTNGTEYLRRDYEDLRRDYEDLRRDYEDLRRPFAVSADVPYTDVWTFATVQGYPGKHPCEKPLAMMEHIVQASSRLGDVVLDCCMGSGNVGVAATKHGRRFVGMELSEHWCNVAREKLAQPQQMELANAC